MAVEWVIAFATVALVGVTWWYALQARRQLRTSERTEQLRARAAVQATRGIVEGIRSLPGLPEPDSLRPVLGFTETQVERLCVLATALGNEGLDLIGQNEPDLRWVAQRLFEVRRQSDYTQRHMLGRLLVGWEERVGRLQSAAGELERLARELEGQAGG